MAQKNVSDEKWAHARAWWEGDPTISYAQVGQFLGVSRQAVYQESVRKGWQRRAEVAQIVQEAHAQADAESVVEPAHSPERAIPVYSLPSESPAAPTFAAARSAAVDMRPDQASAVVEREAVAARKNVVSKHRKEWLAVEARLYPLMRAEWSDDVGEQRKSLKTLVEALQTKQQGERRAWGLDIEDRPENMLPPSITVNRVQGLKIVR